MDAGLTSFLALSILAAYFLLTTRLTMKKVTGLGGIFFKCDNPRDMQDWYAKNLGLAISEYGTTFEWRQVDNPAQKGSTTWGTFAQDADNFQPSAKPFMINYRVENLVELVAELKKANVTIVGEIAEYDYGKFVHVLDPEGNILELWEPAVEEAQENEPA
jgi:predicted enzyme related to lactoylglutathione lyase